MLICIRPYWRNAGANLANSRLFELKLVSFPFRSYLLPEFILPNSVLLSWEEISLPNGACMKFFTAAVVIAVSMFGCASTNSKSSMNKARTPSSEATHACVATEGPSCPAKIRWICEKGFHDACRDNFEGNHRCVADSRGSCNLRIMIHCPEGFVNGCNTGETSVHQCVPVTSRMPCAQEIAMECPDGFIDRCLLPENQ